MIDYFLVKDTVALHDLPIIRTTLPADNFYNNLEVKAHNFDS